MKKHLAFNPYLPAWEHIPDGEPHVFGDRLYIFGSHDADHGDEFCLLDYVVWSAPLSDPGNWHCHGVAYRKEQDPLQHSDQIFTPPPRVGKPHLLFAPDAAQGTDGRYYLYYALDFSNIVSVAVSDTPEGPYTFLAHVTRPDGTRPLHFQWFDPAVYVEDGRVFLYVGSAPEMHFPGMPDAPIPGAMGMELCADMHTIRSEPVCVANGVETAAGTSFAAHPFFEASSLRRFGDRYYFIYSSLQGHELCYATASDPLGPFTYQGVLISNGDVGLNGSTQPVYYLGNNHGSVVQLGERYYVFWHRHTCGGQFSRQGCADEIFLRPDGSFAQAEITSCGLNGAPLPTGAVYRASIACCLIGPDREGMKKLLPLRPENSQASSIPYVTGCTEPDAPEGYRSWIENLRPMAVTGFKYLAFSGAETRCRVTLRGRGSLLVHLDTADASALAQLTISSEAWTTAEAALSVSPGTHAVYFTVAGDRESALDFCDFAFL